MVGGVSSDLIARSIFLLGQSLRAYLVVLASFASLHQVKLLFRENALHISLDFRKHATQPLDL